MTLSRFLTVAVDGGAASGKSSTSSRLAAKYNLLHVDTGSHYRAVTLALLNANTPAEEEAAKSALKELPLGTEITDGKAFISINGEVPQAEHLRSEKVNSTVSNYAALPPVREFLFDYQRSQKELAQQNKFAGLIMEGRDIGSVIFPDADLRIFLEADPVKRAERRAAEGQTDAILKRDQIDSTRKTAPLVCPEGATKVDTGAMNLEEVVDHLSNLLTSL